MNRQYQTIYLECTQNGSNKFYMMEPNDDGVNFTATYGRIGSIGQTHVYHMSRWSSLLNEKRSKGYVPKTNPRVNAQTNTTATPQSIIDAANANASKYIILNGTDDATCPLQTTDAKGQFHIYYRIMSNCEIELPSGQLIPKGTIGGFIESPECLDQTGNCWVADDARISCGAKIRENAVVGDHAVIDGKASVYGNAIVTGQAIIQDEAVVFGNAHVYENAVIKDSARVLDRALVGGKTIFGGAAMVCADAWYETDNIYLESKMYENTVLAN